MGASLKRTKSKRQQLPGRNCLERFAMVGGGFDVDTRTTNQSDSRSLRRRRRPGIFRGLSVILTEEITASHTSRCEHPRGYHRHNTRLPNQVSGLADERASPQRPGLTGVAVASIEIRAMSLVVPTADEACRLSARTPAGVAKYTISDD